MVMDMKNVLILNQAHTSNLGDVAIGMSLENWVRENGWNPITMPFWDEASVFWNISYSTLSAVIKSLPLTADIVVGSWVKNTINNVLHKDRIDCAICGGGELFCSHRGFNAVFSCWVNELQKQGIPCCVLGVSGDENLNGAQIKRNRHALEKCFLVGVRDGHSKEVFRKLYGIEAKLTPDSVFLLGEKAKLDTAREKTICVPVPAITLLEGSTETEADFYHRVIEDNRRSSDHVILTTTELRDEEYTLKLREQINQKYGTDYQYVAYSGFEGFCSLLDEAHTVISGRMHAMIMGLLYGCGIKSITFKPKLKSFEEEYGRCTEINEVVNRTREGYKKYAEMLTNVMETA